MPLCLPRTEVNIREHGRELEVAESPGTRR
jgi:hypothetical protein